eukprot:scaffold298049_cov18-Tisochrysis_lutea.AAC.1
MPGCNAGDKLAARLTACWCACCMQGVPEQENSSAREKESHVVGATPGRLLVCLLHTGTCHGVREEHSARRGHRLPAVAMPAATEWQEKAMQAV